MTVQPSPYDILRSIQDQQAVMLASYQATTRLVTMLAGMLDKSGPDPILSGRPSEPALPALPGARPAPPTNQDRRQKGENARPPFLVDIAGVEVKTTERRARLLAAVTEAPATLSELARQAIAPNVAGVKAQIIDVNRDLQRAGLALRVRVQAKPAQRVGSKGGRMPALYALLGPEDAAPDNPRSVQSEAQAGARPEEETSDSAVGGGEHVAAQDVPFVAQTGAEEGGRTHGDPAPAADAIQPAPAFGIVGGFERTLDLWRDPDLSKSEIARKLGISRTTVVKFLADGRAAGDERVAAGDARRHAALARPTQAETAPAPTQPVRLSEPVTAKPVTGLTIEPGDLLAVDVRQKLIQTAQGSYTVGGVNLARALNKMRGGHLFGLDVIARVAGWPSADVARTALGFERNRLAEHGLELFMDKFNARLRVAS